MTALDEAQCDGKKLSEALYVRIGHKANGLAACDLGLLRRMQRKYSQPLPAGYPSRASCPDACIGVQ